MSMGMPIWTWSLLVLDICWTIVQYGPPITAQNWNGPNGHAQLGHGRTIWQLYICEVSFHLLLDVIILALINKSGKIKNQSLTHFSNVFWTKISLRSVVVTCIITCTSCWSLLMSNQSITGCKNRACGVGSWIRSGL